MTTPIKEEFKERLHCVFLDCDYENDQLKGIFSSDENAKEYIANSARPSRSRLYIQEWTINEGE